MDQATEAPTAGRARGRQAVLLYVLVAVGFILLASYGTAIYNFFIPTVVGRGDFSLGLGTLAVIGGAAAFLSPCAFGMLPAYFASYLQMNRPGTSRAHNVSQALRCGIAAGLGMMSVAVVLGGLVLLLGASFAPGLRVVTPVANPYAQNFRIAAGLFLVVLGVLQWYRRPLTFGLAGVIGRAQTEASSLSRRLQSPLLTFYLYGVLYVLVAMPCVANLMAAPLLAALATQGLPGVVATGSLFFSTMAVLMVGTSIAIGLTNEALVLRMRASVPTLQRVGGLILVLVGLTLVYLTLDRETFRQLFFHFPIR